MTQETCRRTRAVALSLVIGTVLCVQTAFAQSVPVDGAGLSPYWEHVVSRWDNVIVHYADRRHLDPDFVASVIWKESRGVSTVEGPTGAVGLMCVKPFPWRPSADELKNPWINVAAGTRTLAHVIRDGNGDAFYGLAAYNGGWDQIHLRVTRNYAADVLQHYARAVAVEQGLPHDGSWIALLAVEGRPDHRTVTVLGPDRPVARYTDRPWSRAALPSVPAGHPPHATLITFEDEHGRQARVDLWLLDGDPPFALVHEPGASSLSSSLLRPRELEGATD